MADKLSGPCANFSASPRHGSMVAEQANVRRSFLGLNRATWNASRRVAGSDGPCWLHSESRVSRSRFCGILRGNVAVARLHSPRARRATLSPLTHKRDDRVLNGGWRLGQEAK